ncbi:hydroxymethylglutaryl-CoA synthase 1 [Thrips palmi]|uniref:Hydroxymethylglutaryl-CoA synthase n=1 Tax=Thrips palmi TaxID=161013 RepID=A0A6P8YZV1_THRPL|nr:hydroxymethylglutaryl-CoA synthase 1 [Thrips palmi]
MAQWPKDVGILAIEAIFPAQYVDQEDLEKFDNVSAGKYTKGLGQAKMGFCTDREDINSLCLTVTSNLLRRYNIDKSTIGRLEVGTETILDKSKSVKTVLMQLFEEEGHTDLEGIDSKNACYGGTAALFNSLNWVESSAWDGRNALVVCGDIAVYPRGSARPTGGAGAIAMLVGPNAPLVVDRGVRSSHMQHVYDFYKPNPLSEYPTVDGHLSVKCYLSALDKCFQRYCTKAEKNLGIKQMSLDHLDAILFHSPYCKLVRKSLARLVLNDFVRLPLDTKLSKYPPLAKFAGVKLEETYTDRDVEKASIDSSEEIFAKKTAKSLRISNQNGNMYTPSLYGGLISHLTSHSASELAGTRLALFSYGSGLSSSMFSIKVAADGKPGSPLHKLVSQLAFINPMLERRTRVPPEDYTKVLSDRESDHKLAPYTPSAPIDALLPGTYYLTHVDEMHRRTYAVVPS